MRTHLATMLLFTMMSPAAAQPAMPAELVQPAMPAELVQPAMPAELVQPAMPAELVQPAMPMRLMLPPPAEQPQPPDAATDPLLRALARPATDDGLLARIADAVRRHPAAGIAGAGAQAAAAEATQARAALLPRIEASLSGTEALARDFSGVSTIIESAIPRGRADAQIGLEAPLFEPGGLGRFAAARARTRAAQAGTQDALATTALEALSAHYQLLALTGLADLAQARTSRHREISAATAQRIEAGLAPAAELARARSGLAMAEADETRLARALEAARARYQAVFGLVAPPALGRPPVPARLPISLDEARTRAALVPDVAAARAAAEAARAEARAARADRLPTIGASLSATRFNAFQPGPNSEVRGTLVLRQRLSLGGAEAARVRQADARARAADFEADRALMQAEQQAHTAFADLQGQAATAASLRAAYAADLQSRDVMAEDVRLRRGALLELIRAEDALAATASALWQASLEADLAAFQLAARTGILNALLGLASGDQ